MVDDTIIYIYAHIDPRDRLPHYIGQSKNPIKRYTHHKYESKHAKHNPTKQAWLLDLNTNNLDAIIIILEITTPDKARSHEAAWIEQGLKLGWPLVNIHKLWSKNTELFKNNLNDAAADYIQL